MPKRSPRPASLPDPESTSLADAAGLLYPDNPNTTPEGRNEFDPLLDDPSADAGVDPAPYTGPVVYSPTTFQPVDAADDELPPYAPPEPPPIRPGDEPLPSDDWFSPLTNTTDHLKMLYFGREGTSKTTSALRSANFGRVLLINAEGGAKVRALTRNGVNTDNITTYPLKPGDPVTVRGLEQIHARLLADLQADPRSWYAVVIDSWSEVSMAALERVSDIRVEKLTKIARARNTPEPDQDFTDIADYGTMTKQLRRLLRRFRDLPCHVVFTALERVDNEETVPDMSPKIRSDTLGMLDLVLYFRATPASPDPDRTAARFRALTQADSDSGIRAKDRFGLLPAVLALPTFDRIVAYLDEDLTEDTDPVQAAYRRVRALDARKEAEAEAAKNAKRTRPARAAAN